MIKKCISSASLPSVLFLKNNWWFWTAALTIIFLGLNFFLLFGYLVGIWDVDGAFMPYQIFVADYARVGRFPLWDLWTNGGVPISGDPQVGVFSPINFISGFLFGGSTGGFRFYWLFVWWLGGFGVMMLGRHLKAASYASAVIALGYLFSGIYITNAQHTSFIIGFSFLPLIIWRLDVALSLSEYTPALEAGAIWGLSALSCYPAYTILTILYCCLWAAGRLFFDRAPVSVNNVESNVPTKTSRASFRFVSVSLFIMIFVGILVLSPTYFSFIYEGTGVHTRTGALSRELVLTQNSLAPGALATLASPYVAIQKLSNPYLWVDTDVSMSSIYAGAIVSVMALFALINASNDKWRRWLLFLALFSLACALSRVFPFRGWLYDFLYPTRFFKHSAVFRSYYLFSVTVLALVGIRDFAGLIASDSIKSWRAFRTGSQSLAAVVSLVFITFINSLPAVGSKTNLAYLHIFVVWVGLIVLSYGGRRISHRIRWIAVPALLIILAVFDAFCVYRLSVAVMAANDAVSVQRWQNLDRRHTSDTNLTTRGLNRQKASCADSSIPCLKYSELTNDQLIDKIPVFEAYSTQENIFQVMMTKNSVLEAMAIGEERIWFSAQVAEMPPTLKNYEAFTERTSNLERSPLVIHKPDDMINIKFNAQKDNVDAEQPVDIANLPAVERIGVKVIKYAPEELIFEANCPADGWILVTDRWARVWRAEVNGRDTPVYGGNFIFRAIKASSGVNTIRLTYQPFFFPYLLILSWGIMTFILIILPLFRLRKNRKPQQG